MDTKKASIKKFGMIPPSLSTNRHQNIICHISIFAFFLGNPSGVYLMIQDQYDTRRNMICFVCQLSFTILLYLRYRYFKNRFLTKHLLRHLMIFLIIVVLDLIIVLVCVFQCHFCQRSLVYLAILHQYHTLHVTRKILAI